MGTSIGDRTPLGDPVAFEGGLVDLAERTHAWIQPNGGLGESNAGLVIGDGSALLIDTLWDERLTAAMLAATAPVCDGASAPIGQLFNTHGDGDHWYGNGLLGPEVEMIASGPAIEQMRAEPPSLLTRMMPVMGAAGLLGRVPMVPGGAGLRGLGGFGSMLGAYEFGGIHPRVPERYFTDAATLDVGGRSVEISFVGPAHTIGDAIAWVPDVRVVFAGDILFNGAMPIMWAGPVGSWIAALERIEALGPVAVVGGHGPVGDLAAVGRMREYWTWLRDEVLAAGDDLDTGRLAERLIGSAEFEPWRGWSGAERTYVNIARIAATESGGGSDLGTAERVRLLSGMGALAERLSG